jgi:predicted GIY-YIG superfamily endonuclease
MFKRLDEIVEGDFNAKPGIYTFYYKPRIATYDLYEDDNKAGAEELMSQIDDKFINPLNSKRHKNKIYMGYETKLEGEVTYSNRTVREKVFSNKVASSSFKAVDIYQEFKVRKAFRNIMNDLEHFFSAPIYIGVSHNVDERIVEHRSDYFETKDLLSKSAQISDDSFGARAANFALAEELYVKAHYFDAEEYELTKKQSYDLAIITEWVIQQQYKPILGIK